MKLLREVQDYICQQNLLKTGDRVVVGVSGGPDSVALLHLLRRLAEPLTLDLHVAHLHHGIRAAEADADAEFVSRLATAWDLPCTIQRVDVPTIAAHEKLTLEQAARHARYGFFCNVAQHIDAHKIAVGHNADDQSETVLMHLLRGAGSAGLRGMLPSRSLRDYHFLRAQCAPAVKLQLIRPLLRTPRTVIVQYCTTHNVEFRLDCSNLDTTFFRNQLRHEVRPYLAQINPQIDQRLCYLAEVLRAEYDIVQEFVNIVWDALLIRTHPDALTFDLRSWREQPLALRRALIRKAAYALRYTLRDVDFVHTENAVRVAQTGQTGAEATLPRGLCLSVGYTTLSIADRHALYLPAEQPWLAPESRIPFDIPGQVALPGDWTFHAQPVTHWNLDTLTQNANPFVAWMDMQNVRGPLVLRTRQPGDRFSPQGMHGSQVRLSDFLINVKMPQAWRNYLPLVADEAHILWVAGLRLNENILVYPETQHVVYFHFRCHTHTD